MSLLRTIICPRRILPPLWQSSIEPRRLRLPDPNLCGAGVAFKLAHAVLAGLDAGSKNCTACSNRSQAGGDRDVADIVPLTGENRVIVKQRVEWASRRAQPRLRALLNAAGFAGRAPDAGEVAFRIAPAINASGRMDSAGQAVFAECGSLTSDAEESESDRARAVRVESERQTAERSIVNEIFERCVGTPVTDRDAALVFGAEGCIGAWWDRGEPGGGTVSRPVVVLGVENGVAQGSGRSIEAFHLLDALESMRELFTKFGGHAHAAGLTLPEAALDVFRERLRAWAASA